jgi:integrase
LNVGDLHQNRGFDALHVIRKGGRREALAINPQAAQRIRAYLEQAGHGDQLDAPLFRPLRGNARPLNPAGRMDPDAIARLVRKYAAEIGLGRGYSAHSTCRRRRGTATRPQQSSTTGATTIRKKPPASLRPTDMQISNTVAA